MLAFERKWREIISASVAVPVRGILCLFLQLLVGGGCESGPGERTASGPWDGAGQADRLVEPRAVGPVCAEGAGLQRQTVAIVHVADLHARYTPERDEDPLGANPFSRIRGYVDAARAENPYTLFTDGGDDHEKGALAEVLSEGRATGEVVHAMGFDLRTLGNHDFAWSLEEALAFSLDPHAATLCSNVRYKGSEPDRFGAVDYVEIQAGCVRLGFFGMVTRPYQEQSRQYDDDFYPELESRYDFIERAAEIVERYRDQVDLMVMLSHLGVDDDRLIAGSVPGIDLILGGHTHAEFEEAEVVGGAILAHPGAWALALVHIDLDFELPGRRLAGYRYQLVTNTPGQLPSNPELERTIDRVMRQYAPGALQEVGWLEQPQDAAGIARIAAEAATETLAVDAAAVDVNGVMVAWEAGGVTAQDMLDAFQLERHPPGTTGDSSFYLVNLSGADLLRVREQSDGFTFTGPEPIEAEAGYRLALQKPVALHPRDYLPAGVSVGSPRFAAEAWEVLDSLARARSASCLFLDSGRPMGECP